MRLCILLLVFSVVACSGSDTGMFDARTSFTVTHKGCYLDRSGRSDILVDIANEHLPDGRVQCVIRTVVPRENAKDDK